MAARKTAHKPAVSVTSDHLFTILTRAERSYSSIVQELQLLAANTSEYFIAEERGDKSTMERHRDNIQFRLKALKEWSNEEKE